MSRQPRGLDSPYLFCSDTRSHGPLWDICQVRAQMTCLLECQPKTLCFLWLVPTLPEVRISARPRLFLCPRCSLSLPPVPRSQCSLLCLCPLPRSPSLLQAEGAPLPPLAKLPSGSLQGPLSPLDQDCPCPSLMQGPLSPVAPGGRGGAVRSVTSVSREAGRADLAVFRTKASRKPPGAALGSQRGHVSLPLGTPEVSRG